MLDTNILVSMIFFPSEVTKTLARMISEKHRILICDYVIKELELVTDRKFPHKKLYLERFFIELPFEMIYTPKELNLQLFPEVRDIKDSPILATAILEEIDVFITGDNDFLVLDLEKPEIMNMRDFINKY